MRRGAETKRKALTTRIRFRILLRMSRRRPRVLGALLLTVLSNVLVGKGYTNADQQIIFGVLILVVVTGYGRDPRPRDRV